MPKSKLDPLPSAAFHILLALSGDDLHGYAIMREVADLTKGRVRLGPGTLYSSIKTLLEAGLIAELNDLDGAHDGDRNKRPADDSTGERRRFYRLTASGRKLARAEADGLAETLRIARARKLFRGAHV